MPSHQIGKAAYWSIVDTLLRQGGQFIITVILARHIAPTEFGLIALLSIFTTVASIVINGGMATALIQRQDHTDEDESTVFWFNLAVGTIMSIVLALAAPLISTIFNQPRLIALTYAMALNLWFSAFITVHQALLSKKMDFYTQAKASIIAVTISGGFAIWLAYRGAGVWAIVAQYVVLTLTTIIMLWSLHKWRPKMQFSLDSYRRLFNFGGFILISQIVDVIATRLYTVVLGRLGTPHDVGIYNRAITTRDFVQVMMSSSFSRMAFPLFSSQAHDTALLKDGLSKSIVIMMSVNAPIMLGLSAVAQDFVPVVFGPAWQESGAVLQILSIAGVFWPMHLANLNALMAQGHSRLYLRLELIKKMILLTAVVLSARYGMLAIAWATLVSSFAGLLINAHYSGKFLSYPFGMQMRTAAPYILSAIVMAALIVVLRSVAQLGHTFMGLAAEVLIGALVYGALIHALSADRHVIGFLKNLMHKAG